MKRYDIFTDSVDRSYMDEDPDGDYVLYEEAASIRAQVEQLEADLKAANADLETIGNWRDEPDEYTPLIDAAHPCETKDHATYWKALEMVNHRYGKYELVALVNWLLSRATRAEAELAALKDEQRKRDTTFFCVHCHAEFAATAEGLKDGVAHEAECPKHPLALRVRALEAERDEAMAGLRTVVGVCEAVQSGEMFKVFSAFAKGDARCMKCYSAVTRLFTELKAALAECVEG